MKRIFQTLPIVALALILSAGVQAQEAESQRGMGESGEVGIYEKNYHEKMIIPYDHIREADVFWAKRIWRVIDVREKMNLPFKNPNEPLITILLDNIANERLTAFQEEQFIQPMTPADVSKIGAGSDTIQLYDQYGNWRTDTVVVNEFNPETVQRYRIMEDWVFDEETSTMQVRIIGIAPLRQDPDAGIDIPMFWAYFPDLRPILVNYEAFNFLNDAQRLTWEDVFIARIFSSYIIKESNVYDRRISDYATGVDALLESENIKQEIFEFEHDLWEY